MPAIDVITKARSGDLHGAIAAGELALAVEPGDNALRLFVGVLHCRAEQFEAGVEHLRRVLTEEPGNGVAKIELARGLLAAGHITEALSVSADGAPDTPSGRDLLRVKAHALLHTREAAEANRLFSTLVDADSADFESHHGLGLALLATGEPRAALSSFRKAVSLRPSAAAFWVNLSRAAAIATEWPIAADAAERALSLAPSRLDALLAAARARAGLGDGARAEQAINEALALGGPSADMWNEIAEIYGQMRHFDDAISAFRHAISREPSMAKAWIGLGNVLERLNRQADLKAHIEAATQAGIPEEALALLKARLARKAGRHEDALLLAQSASPDGDPATRAQLIGVIADRLGRYDEAFAAFAEANASIAASTKGMESEAEANLANYAAMGALLTPAWLDSWPRFERRPADGRRDPLFIFGFPRSGTTLIDTMLGGHPDAVVLEEEAVIQKVAARVGRPDRIPTLSAYEIAELRAYYFSEADKRTGQASNLLIVDKEPLGLSSTLLLHRLFPDSRFVFAERHPCDVVLSCWMTSLRFDHHVGSFHSLVATARLYDAVLSFWSQCVRQLPLRTIAIRYERLVVDPEPELRRLANFAGLDWQPSLLTNERNAARRAYIGSPSYAQVGEPLYQRASGRWIHYRPGIDCILPILSKWIDTLNYDKS